MAQPQLQADFFVGPSGAIFAREKPLNTRQRKEVFQRDGGACRACGQAVTWTRSRQFFGPSVGAVDHIIPRARGGRNTPENLQLLCEGCNARKGAK